MDPYHIYSSQSRQCHVAMMSLSVSELFLSLTLGQTSAGLGPLLLIGCLGLHLVIFGLPSELTLWIADEN